MRSGDSGASCQQEQAGASGGDESGQNHHGFSMSNDNTTSLAATMELFTQRSEKKRLKKSLKKLTKAQNGGGGQATESNGFQTDSGEPTAAGESAGLDDGNRKHHKHKKRKKHKKHHRKNDNEEAEPTQDGQLLAAVAATPVEELLPAATTAQRVKVEVKVKAEQLDMEEETTSNLMSEVSDEVRPASIRYSRSLINPQIPVPFRPGQGRRSGGAQQLQGKQQNSCIPARAAAVGLVWHRLPQGWRQGACQKAILQNNQKGQGDYNGE